MDDKKNIFSRLEVVLTAPSRFIGKTLDEFATSPVAEKIESQLPKTLTGIAEAPVTLSTGLGGFMAGMAGQAAKTASDIFGVAGQPEMMSAAVYDMWRSGFRNVSGEGFKPRNIMKKFGENSGVFNELMQLFTVEPKTPEGEHVVRTAMAPFEAYEKSVDFIGEKAGMSPEEREGLKFFARLAYGKVAKAVKNVPARAQKAHSTFTANRALADRFAEMEREGYSPKQIENAFQGEKIWQDARRELAQKKKEGKSGLRNTFVREFIDVSGNMKRVFNKMLADVGEHGVIPKEPLPIREQQKGRATKLEINDKAITQPEIDVKSAPKTEPLDINLVPNPDIKVDIDRGTRREELSRKYRTSPETTPSERARNVIIHHDLNKGSTSRGLMIAQDSTKKLVEGLTNKEVESLENGVKAARELAIAQYKPNAKHPGGVGVEVFIDQLHSLPPKILEKVTEYEKLMRENTIDRLLTEGIISKQQHTDLASKGIYSPKNLIEYIDVDTTSTLGPAGKESVAGSGLKNLRQTSEGLIDPNAIQQLMDVTLATDARIGGNRVGKSLYRLATNEPENGVVSIVHPDRMDKPPPRGQEYIYTMIDGRKHAISMPKEIASEFVKTDPAFNRQFANALSWVLGSKILKAQATGYNPEFAASNIFRDAGLIWMATDEYSAISPVMVGQLVKDVATVLPDVIMKKGRYKDYVLDGGGMQLLTQQGQFKPGVSGPIGALQEVLGFLGERSELATRLALRERAIKNGKSRLEATHAATNYLDFRQGGRSAKAIDVAVPYLNPSIQGTRSVFRFAKTKPALFAAKVAQLMVLAQGLYLANREQYGDEVNNISDQDRINNWNIMTPLTYKDSSGTTRRHIIKIPKDQSQRALGILFEGMIAKVTGDEDFNYGMITTAGKQSLPVVPTEALPPAIEGALTYGFNKDFWTNEDVWRGTEQSDKTQEYTDRTPPVYVKGAEILKKATGIEVSPERARAALSNVFTRNNPYSELVGMGINEAMGEMTEADRNKVSAQILQQIPGVRKFLGSTNPNYRLLRQAGDIGKEENTRRTMQHRGLDALIKPYYEQESMGYKPSKDPVKDYIRKQPKEDQKRLIDRFVNYGRTIDLPNKSWWMMVGGMTPESRAEAFYNEYKKKPPDEQKEMERQAFSLQGFVSDRFKSKFNKLRGKVTGGDTEDKAGDKYTGMEIKY